MSDGVVFSAKKAKEKLKEKGAYHTKKELALLVKSKLEELAGGKKIDRVMDICCGSGGLLNVFGDDVIKIGVDIEKEFIQYCKENLKGEFYELNALLLRSVGSPYIVGNYPFGLRDKELAIQAWEYIKAYNVVFKDMPELPSLLDCAFFAKNLQCLYDDGKAVLIVGLGILYRGAKEYDFRKWLINTGWIKSIEVVSGDYFDDTKISVGIVCIDKAKTSKEIDFIEKGKRVTASFEEIEKNDFSLSVNRYIISEERLAEQKKLDDFDIEAQIELVNNLEIKGLELTLKGNHAVEQAGLACGKNHTANEKLIRGVELKLKEWKKKYLPQKKIYNAPSLFEEDL